MGNEFVKWHCLERKQRSKLLLSKYDRSNIYKDEEEKLEKNPNSNNLNQIENIIDYHDRKTNSKLNSIRLKNENLFTNESPKIKSNLFTENTNYDLQTKKENFLKIHEYAKTIKTIGIEDDDNLDFETNKENIEEDEEYKEKLKESKEKLKEFKTEEFEEEKLKESELNFHKKICSQNSIKNDLKLLKIKQNVNIF